MSLLNHLPHSLSRRDLLQLSAATVATSCVSGWLHPLAARAAAQAGRHKSCIVVWLEGGLSQLESFDMKKDSYFQPIATSVPGIEICERLPKLATLMQHAAVIRSMNTPENEHARARYHTHTGTRQVAGGVVFPSLGSIVSMELGKPDYPLPNYVVIRTGGRGLAGSGSGYLGSAHQPLFIDDLSRGVENLAPVSSMQRFDRRLSLLEEVEQGFYKTAPSAPAESHLTTLQRASKMMHSKEAQAYDLTREPQESRDAYGKARYSDACLLARRLIEVGVPFVEVSLPEWDNHSGCKLHEENLPPLDMALSALITDLHDRGLLDSTLVVLMSEFGRGGRGRVGVPGREDRGHWNRAWSTVLFGGGIRGGQIIGRTDDIAGAVEDRLVTIGDFFATICTVLGIDYLKENTDPGGRPVPIVVDAQSKKPQVVTEVL